MSLAPDVIFISGAECKLEIRVKKQIAFLEYYLSVAMFILLKNRVASNYLSGFIS